MKIKKLLRYFIYLQLFHHSIFAQSWQFVGHEENFRDTLFSEGIGQYVSVSLSSSDIPFVAYQANSNSTKLRVLSFDGFNWNMVGPVINTQTQDISLKISPSGMPVVAFSDGYNNHKTTVLSFNGSNWSALGATGTNTGVGFGPAYNQSLAISPSGMPVVAYQGYLNRTTVLSFNGSNWSELGAISSSTGINTLYTSNQYLAIGPSGMPVVSYQDNFHSFKIAVLSFNGISWSALGSTSTGISGTDDSNYQCLAIDSLGMPLVAYTRREIVGTNSVTKVYVLSFNGNNFSPVGIVSTNTGVGKVTDINSLSIAINSPGKPFISFFEDVSNTSIVSKSVVLSFDGSNWTSLKRNEIGQSISKRSSLAINSSNMPLITNGYPFVLSFTGEHWIPLGGVGISGSSSSEQSLAFTPNGMPVVAYIDNLASGKTSVLSFNGINWNPLGGLGISEGRSTFQSLAISPTGQPIVSYLDFFYGNRLTVLSFNGSNWSALGGSGIVSAIATFQNIVVNSAGVPIVAFDNYFLGSKISVISFDGNNWGSLGTSSNTITGISPVKAENGSMVLNPSGMPIIAFCDFNNSQKTSVLSFNGINWNSLGNAAISTGNTLFHRIVLSSYGMPVVAYNDFDKGSVNVISFNGINWVDLGGQGQNILFASYISLAISEADMPIFSYNDISNPGRNSIKVVSFNGSNWSNVGSNPSVSLSYGNQSSLKFNPLTKELYIAYSGIGEATYVQRFGRAYQKINLPDRQSAPLGTSPLNMISVTATSGLTVSLVSSNNAVASFNGSNLILNTIGVTTITAFQNGNDDYFGVTMTGVLTVTKSNLIIKTLSTTKIYGEPIPNLVGTVTGIIDGDLFSVTYSTSATSLSGVGKYLITPSITGPALGEYTLVIQGGTLTIIPANLTVSANNFFRKYGESNPIFTGSTITGLLNGDNVTALFSSTANDSSSVGNYPITISLIGNGKLNYSLTANNGILTITKANQDITHFGPIDDVIFPDVNQLSLTALATSGLPVSYSISGVGSILGRTLNLTGQEGMVNLTSMQPGNANYEAAITKNISFNVHIKLVNTSTTGILLTKNTQSPISIYPNPNIGNFIIESETSNITYVICTLEGTVLKEGSLMKGTNTINAKLFPGIYLVKINAIITKIIIE